MSTCSASATAPAFRHCPQNAGHFKDLSLGLGLANSRFAHERDRQPDMPGDPIASASALALVAGFDPQPARRVALRAGASRGHTRPLARRRPEAAGAAQRPDRQIRLLRLLAVVAARALGDEPRLRALSAHPSRCVRLCAVNSLPLDAGDPEAFAAQYVVCPVGERRRLRRRLIDERHHDLAAALLTAPITDRERASLLVACDSATVAEHLPELGDLVPNLASLAKRHPDVFLAELRRRVTDAPADRRAAAWRWAAPALRRLTHSRPRELALLLAEVERSQGLPEPFYAVAGPLLAAAPGEMVQVLPPPSSMTPGMRSVSAGRWAGVSNS